jgi:hypothetical protein
MTTLTGGATMARQKADGPKKGRTWDERKDRIQSIAVFRDVARMAARVAKDEGLSIAELTDPLLRGPLAAKYKRILERELKGMGDPPG